MRTLVFVSKWIGLKCVESLLIAYPDDDYHFVVLEPDSDMIIDRLIELNQGYKLLNEETVQWIENHQEDYFDWLLNLWGSYIFKEKVLNVAKHSMNIHPSFLPYGRGMDPVVWAIKNGDPAGVTLHEITLGVDEGPIYYQEQIDYTFPTTGGELYDDVVDRCIKVFSEQWPIIRNNNDINVKLNISNSKTKNRKDLYEDNFIILEENKLLHEFILRLLAHDFGEHYSMKLISNDKTYSMKLALKELINVEEKNV